MIQGVGNRNTAAAAITWRARVLGGMRAVPANILLPKKALYCIFKTTCTGTCKYCISALSKNFAHIDISPLPVVGSALRYYHVAMRIDMWLPLDESSAR